MSDETPDWYEPQTLDGEFRFTVGRQTHYDGDTYEVRYVAELPHQHDGWTIVDDPDPVAAVRRLAQFVVEAQLALSVLRHSAPLPASSDIVVRNHRTIIAAPSVAMVEPETLAHLAMYISQDLLWVGDFPDGEPCHYRVTGWDGVQKKLILTRAVAS